MKSSLTPEAIDEILARVRPANEEYARAFPGESPARQPVHTFYGGAHLFKADTARRLGTEALAAMREYAPNFTVFAKALDLPGAHTLPTSERDIRALESRLTGGAAMGKGTGKGKKAAGAGTGAAPHAGAGAGGKDGAAWLAHAVYSRVAAKLESEAVEDYRIDFEDGYGTRPDAEEDGHAASAALEVARGMAEQTLPPFFGIRIKPFSEELKRRTARTLDLFVSTLVECTSGRLPDNFVVTMPKITAPEQVTALVALLAGIEAKAGLAPGTVKLELMIEVTQSILNGRGECVLPRLVQEAAGRCVGAHFGTYDYTASCNITAAHQGMAHPACDFARHMMKVALAGTGVWLSDGATNVMPVGPHRAARGRTLTAAQRRENEAAVHRVWKLCFGHIRNSLLHAFYQGWDLHPGQLPIRYAACYSFFLEGLAPASARLRAFLDKATQATLVGDVFDDAATGQGLLNYFLRALNCGAITLEEVQAAGLTPEEVRGRSFVKLLEARRG
ncbi:MAG: phosphoenolpyruvate kinase [Planctomycetes bacterium]|nr:phosphoenolpyruvate kinase [Planctomycetota bacterium]